MIKKISCLLFSVVLIFCLGATVFAEDTQAVTEYIALYTQYTLTSLEIYDIVDEDGNIKSAEEIDAIFSKIEQEFEAVLAAYDALSETDKKLLMSKGLV